MAKYRLAGVISFCVAVYSQGCTPAQMKTATDLATTAACIAVKPVCEAATQVCGPVLGGTSGGETP
jgi:hypothetical protein